MQQRGYLSHLQRDLPVAGPSTGLAPMSTVSSSRSHVSPDSVVSAGRKGKGAAPTASPTAGDGQPRKLAQKKKKTSRACIYCQRSHLPCDTGRPCERCVKRGLALSCRDGVRKGVVKYIDNVALQSSSSSSSSAAGPGGPARLTTHVSSPKADDSSLSPSASALLNMQSPYRSLQLVDDAVSDDPFPLPSSDYHPGAQFESAALDREFSMLTDIPDMVDVDARLLDVAQVGGMIPPVSDAMGGLGNVVLSFEDKRPVGPDVVYNRVADPFDYTPGHHHLLDYLTGRFTREDTLRVCRALVSYRPSLLSIIKNLTVNDLIFMEKCFQRLIVEYSKLLAYMGTPTCVWRRTGELALVGKEFSMLTGWKADALLSAPTFIYEVRKLMFFWCFFVCF